MTVAENRLRAVARALAESVPDASVPPLRLPPARRHAHPQAWFVRLAAAMTLIAGLVWTASVTGPRILRTASAAASPAGEHLQASKYLAAPPASPPPASVQPSLAASQYSLLSIADIKGPGHRGRSPLGTVLSALAASARDPAGYSVNSTCIQRTAGRHDVCTVVAWMLGA